MGYDNAVNRALRKWNMLRENHGADYGADYLSVLVQEELRSEQAMACFTGKKDAGVIQNDSRKNVDLILHPVGTDRKNPRIQVEIA